MEPMRVLHVVSGMGLGGIETLLINIYRGIDRTKIQFDFIIHRKTENGFENEIKEMGGKIYYFDPLNLSCAGKYICCVKAFIKEHDEYSIIHIHNRAASSIWSCYAKKYGRFSIVHSHSTTNGYGLKAIAEDILQYPARYYSAYFMGCSKEANVWMFGKKIADSDKCFILHNGIEVERFRFDMNNRNLVRTELGIPESRFVIGSVGRLVPQKNYSFLLAVFKDLKIKHPDVHLVIAGEGSLHGELTAISIDLGISDAVSFLGARSDANRLLSAFDSFALCSKHEGFGISAIEAQANGLPVTASESVPRTVRLTESCEFLGLEEPKDKWIDCLLRSNCLETRSAAYKSVENSVYDIKRTCKWLTDFYFSIQTYKESLFIG